jgi:hypothetical protein
MKRIAWILLCVLLVVGCLCGCSLKKDEAAGNPTTTAAPTTVTAVPSTTVTTTTGALVVTDAQGTVVTDTNGSVVTTHVTALPTTIRPVTDANGTTVTEADGTGKTEIVVPPHITVSTDAQGTTHTSHVTEHTITTTTTTTVTTTTSTTASTTSTTKPTQQEVTVTVSLPAEGYTPDNRIKLGTVKLEGNTVTMVVKNISSIWETDAEDGKNYFEYTCYDKNNAKLSVGRIELGYMQVKSEKEFRFDIPENTAKVALTDFKAEYWSLPV